jgi:alpha-D-ribose 1-methylphosphonate 5-phosphate C-P lyase
LRFSLPPQTPIRNFFDNACGIKVKPRMNPFALAIVITMAIFGRNPFQRDRLRVIRQHFADKTAQAANQRIFFNDDYLLNFFN